MKQVKIGRFELARRFGAIFQNRFKHDSRAQSPFNKVLLWALFMNSEIGTGLGQLISLEFIIFWYFF
jgi:hypothetical protein